MLQKTEMSEASTNCEVKTTSFFTSKNRQMYKSSKKGQGGAKSTHPAQNSNLQHSNDLLILTPTSLNLMAWPAICLVDSDVTVALKSNYYQIAGLRGKKRFVPRNSQVQSEVVYFWADKPTKKIILLAIERYLQPTSNTKELWLHFNLSKYDPESNTSETADFHLKCQHKSDQHNQKQIWDFCSFQLIDNCRKGLLVVKILGGQSDSHYKILLLDLVEKKKETTASKGKNIANVSSAVQLNCELFGRTKEKLIKTIKSEFGDIVLLVTNHEVYQIEVEDLGDGLKLNTKPYKVLKSIVAGKGLKSHEEMVGYQHNQEEIADARFMSNGLKLMLLTTDGQVFLTEANNVLAGQHLREIMATSQLAHKYHLEYFVFEHLYPVNGSIAVEFHAKNNLNLLKNTAKDDVSAPSHEKLLKGVVILKTQGNTLSFAKLINLQLDPKDLHYLMLRECEGIDELLVLYIEKKRPEVVEIFKCRTLVMQLNAMAKIGEAQYNYCGTINLPEFGTALAHFQPNETEKLIRSVSIPDVSKTFYLLREKELVCYKLFTDLDIEKIGKELSYLFSYNFFEKPLKITVNPLTLQFAIVFKEFVKFFYFNYYSIKNFYTLKIKNVNEVRYINRGQKFIVVCNDGNIYLVDSYTFIQTRLMDFYGEVTEANMIDQRHLLVKSAKHILCLFRKSGEEDATQSQFTKMYEIKLEDGDLYHADCQRVIVFRKNAFLEVYSHQLQQIPKNMTEVERECFMKLHDIHPHLQRRVSCNSFEADEEPTSLLLSEELGFVFVATNNGNVKQYLWPVQDPTDPNPPEVLTQHVSSHRIMSLSLDAKLTHLYVVSENGSISQLQITQIINGQQMPYIYVFSQKTRHLDMQKRQFTDKNYFIDSFTPTEALLTQNSEQIIGELEFFLDKLKDDLDQMTKNAISQGKQEEKKLKIETKSQEKNFKEVLKEDDSKYRAQMSNLKSALQQQQKQFERQKAKEVEQYQKALLELYKESDRLKNILRTQDQKMTQEQQAFRDQFQQRMKQLEKQMIEQQSRLEKEYKDIQERRRLAVLQNQIENQEEDAQMQLYKATIHRQEQEELNEAEERKEKLLGDNAKRQKEINNLKHRANYFENLILQTKVQISELTKDQQEYERKKKYLQEQLKDKEQIIERIEHELVVYLKNTEDMKTIKNNHEYQLQEYQKQVGPINENHHSIENNVKHMNMQIMNQYTLKVQKIELINQLSQKAETLKEKKKNTMVKKLQVSGKLNRILEQLVFLATHLFDGDVKKELKALLGDRANEEYDRLDEEKQKQRRQGEKLMRYKNMIRREIEEEEKREEHISKNQHQYYKYHKESTALVREYNELQKAGGLLKAQETKLLAKIKDLKSSLFNTPLRRVPSLSLHKPSAEKKLTPFQRYEEEQTLLSRKQQQTTDTKLSRASQSISFLKGLMKQMGQSQSKYEKMQLMRERVRTFVNPELKARGNRNEEIKKILFGRSRMTSEMLKLK